MAILHSKYFKTILYILGLVVFIAPIVLNFPSLSAFGGQTISLTEQEKHWLSSNREIRLAPDPDFLPIEYFDKEGRYIGMAAEFVALMEKKLGIKLKRIKLENWDEVLEKARQREVDMWGAATPTPQRLEYMMFTKSFLELPAVILVRKKVDQNLTLDTLKNMKVAVISGYGIHDHIINHYPEIDLDVVPNIHVGLNKVSFGMVDAMVANIALATHYIEKEGISNLRVAGETEFVYKWAFASRNDWPELNGILDKGLAAITDQERTAIHKKWIHLENDGWEKIRDVLFVVAILLVLLCFVTVIIYYSLKKALLKSKKEKYALLEHFHTVFKGTSATLGDEFFHSLVHQLSRVLEVKHVFVGEKVGVGKVNGTATSLAFFPEGLIPDNFSYELKGTPCEIVSRGKRAWFPREVQKAFPEDTFLADFGIESYLGIPLKDSSGTVIGHLVIMDDKPMENIKTHEMIMNVFASRTLAEWERQKANRDLVEAKSIAEQASQAKSEFLARMSHELRTPMNSILGFSRLMAVEDGALDKKYRIWLKHINRSGEHLMELIEGILDFSIVESGKLKLNQECMEVHSIAARAVELIFPLAEVKGIQIVNKLPDYAPIQFKGDKLKFQQVLINLLSNAIKYNCEGGSIHIESEYKGDHAYCIFIKDTGIGIPQEKLKDLFQPFERLGAENTEIKGTGIGLAFSRQVMEMMGGTIEVESTPGKGSCFTIELQKIYKHFEASQKITDGPPPASKSRV
jgi:signal transduction histidine kinase/ABC-type amino acid transport substrate-binding protein